MTSNLVEKILKYTLAGTFALGSLNNVYAPKINTGYTPEIHKQFLWDRIVREQNADGIKKPFYRLEPSNCSKYARLSAKKLFNKEYNGAHAWDLKYKNPIVYNFDKEKEVEEAIIDGTLNQGMLINSKWPVRNINRYGTYRKGKDIEGNPIDATHVVQYIGIGKKTDDGMLDLPEPLFLHQWHNKFEILSQKQLWNKYQLEFIKIINDKELEQKERLTTFPEKFF